MPGADVPPPGIGRLVLDPEVFDPALDLLHIASRERTVTDNPLFVPLLSAEDLAKAHRGQKLTHAMAETALSTLPDHPDYIAAYTAADLACTVRNLLVNSKFEGKTRKVRYMAAFVEQDYIGRLHQERAMLLDNIGLEPGDPEESTGLRLRIARGRNFYHTSNLGRALEKLLPDSFTLGPIQLQPPPNST
jgi:hypothetical protein